MRPGLHGPTGWLVVSAAQTTAPFIVRPGLLVPALLLMHVLIIDDHPLYRDGLAAVLSGLQPDIEVTGVSHLAAAAAWRSSPAGAGRTVDLVLLDMALPGVSRLDALQQVQLLFEDSSVVVVSGEDDAQFVMRAIDAGAAGYILKSTDGDAVVQALRTVLSQGVYLPPTALLRPPRIGAHGDANAADLGVYVPSLSDKQRAVLQGLLQGKSNKLIARDLGIAEGTVKAHLWAVYQSLGVNSRSQAMCKAYELGLLGRV
jgi:DNA-binding NarL/FixJ family response regulator